MSYTPTSQQEKPSIFQELGEENEEWRSPGDFYVEPDNVTRGLTISLHDVAPPPPGDAFKGLPDMDFYREPDAVQKGVTLDSSNEALSSFFCHQHVECGMFFEQASIVRAPILSRFSNPDWPPRAPTDASFNFALTTLYVPSREPWTIGNLLLDFFAVEVVSSLSKVNRNKFAFKVDVFQNYTMCTMKVKVCHQEDGQFAIEFQRRQGDSIAFNNVFNKAAQFLKSHGLSDVSSEARSLVDLSPPPLPIQLASIVDETALTALLDLATLTGSPSLQAEAASALAEIAEDDAQCVLLCTEHALQDVMKLFHTSAPEVDYPAARLTHLLARRQEAAPHFAQQGFLPAMVEKIRATTTCMPARDQMACALSAAVQCQSLMALPHSVAFAQTLRECINEMTACGKGNDIVVQNLRSAQTVLSSI